MDENCKIMNENCKIEEIPIDELDNSRRGIYFNLHNNTNIIISVNNKINGTFESNIYCPYNPKEEKCIEFIKN